MENNTFCLRVWINKDRTGEYETYFEIYDSKKRLLEAIIIPGKDINCRAEILGLLKHLPPGAACELIENAPERGNPHFFNLPSELVEELKDLMKYR